MPLTLFCDPADDLPTDLAAEAIWNIVSADFQNVPLWSVLEEHGTSGQPFQEHLSKDEIQKARCCFLVACEILALFGCESVEQLCKGEIQKPC